MKKVLAVILLVAMVATLAGCGSGVKMPYNGDITFHKICLTVPTRFIRDSTQSNVDTWLFERAYYTEYLLVMRKDFEGDVAESLQNYVRYMNGNGGNSEQIDFRDGKAVHTTYTKDDLFCQEILFVYGDSVYAVALRGGTTEGFQEIVDTIQFADK